LYWKPKGSAIRKARAAAQLTQEGLAAEAKCSKNTISNLEREETNVLFETLADIANVLGKKIEELGEPLDSRLRAHNGTDGSDKLLKTTLARLVELEARLGLRPRVLKPTHDREAVSELMAVDVQSLVTTYGPFDQRQFWIPGAVLQQGPVTTHAAVALGSKQGYVGRFQLTKRIADRKWLGATAYATQREVIGFLQQRVGKKDPINLIVRVIVAQEDEGGDLVRITTPNGGAVTFTKVAWDGFRIFPDEDKPHDWTFLVERIHGT